MVKPMLFAQRYAFNQDYAMEVYCRERERRGEKRGIVIGLVKVCRKQGFTIDEIVRIVMREVGLKEKAALKQVHKICRKLADKED